MVVDGSGDLGVHGSSAELFTGDLLTDGGPDERRPGQVQTRSLGHDQGVTHDGKVGTARHTVPHDRRDLRDPHCTHTCVEIEDPPEIVLIRKDLILHRQIDPGRID